MSLLTPSGLRVQIGKTYLVGGRSRQWQGTLLDCLVNPERRVEALVLDVQGITVRVPWTAIEFISGS